MDHRHAFPPPHHPSLPIHSPFHPPSHQQPPPQPHPHPHQHQQQQQQPPTPTLVCVGGMLRVAAAPPHVHSPSPYSAASSPPSPVPGRATIPSVMTPNSYPRRFPNLHPVPFSTPARANVTPFNHLASPFMASPPFTAPTTPYSVSSPPCTPHPSHPASARFTRSTPHHLPASAHNLSHNYNYNSNSDNNNNNNNSINNPNHNNHQNKLSPSVNTPNLFYPSHGMPPLAIPTYPSASKPDPDPLSANTDLQPQPQTHLLSQKQVRELRRLCRKTANRAEFEDRLIQVRQVASIAAMATSTIHLFDPNNPTSGQPLREWVDKHRSTGADWRDERQLSAEAVAELRRWDRLLKAWARVRYDSQPTPADMRHPGTTSRVESVPGVLRPVRLEFERLSMGASPCTPAHMEKSRNVYSTDFLRLASPVTPADVVPGYHHLANSPVNAIHAHKLGGETPEAIYGRSAWSKPPLTGISSWADTRKPMSEVSINRVGDMINVTVPSTGASSGVQDMPEVSAASRLVMALDQENAIPSAIRRTPALHASTTAKSWRSALLHGSQQATPDDGVLGFRTAAKTLFPGTREDGSTPIALQVGTTPRTAMDWGKLRRGEMNNRSDATTSAWQVSEDKA